MAGSGLDWTFSERALDSTWAALIVRCVSLVVSVGGMLVTALLLSLVSNSISSKVDELRKGKAAVLECDHTLILCWSDKVWNLCYALCQGKQAVGGRPIVILADKDKEQMDSEIESFGIELLGSSITCRNGDPLSKEDLLKVAAQHARWKRIMEVDDGRVGLSWKLSCLLLQFHRYLGQ